MSSFKSHTPVSLTIAEKLGWTLAVADAIRATIQKSITASIYSPSTLPPKPVQVNAAVIRSMFGRTNTRQAQAKMAPSVDTYMAWFKLKPQLGSSYEPAVEDICVDGVETRLLWIGKPWKKTDSANKKVLLYCHGGGFILPLNSGHCSFARVIREEIEKYGQECSVAILEYSLGPEKQFPVPLHQGVLALNHLLAAGCSPSNIAMGGDSAGGHLTLSILSHIMHPHPSVPPVLPLSSPLAAAILVSPWVTFDQSAPAFAKFGREDYVTPHLLRYWGEEAIGLEAPAAELAAGRYHAEPKRAPESWWQGMDRAVKFVGTTVGGREVFLDDVLEWEKSFRAGSGVRAELYVGPIELHDGPLFDFGSGRPPSELSLKAAQLTWEGFKSKL